MPTKRRVCGCGSRRFTWAFLVDVALPGAPRRQRSKQGFATEEDARTAMNDMQAGAASGTLVEPSKLTVGAYLSGWLDTVRRSVRPGTWESTRIHVERYINPAIGDVLLQGLTRAAVKAFYAELTRDGRIRKEGGLSPKTVHNVHGTLRRALEVAFEDSLIVRNPAAKAHALPVDTQERQTWTEDLLRTFLAHVRDDRLYALWRLAAHTGMRRGELAAVRWLCVDLNASTVSVNRTRGKGQHGEVLEGPPKTSRGRRTIDIDPETTWVLREHRRAQRAERREWGESYVDSGYVFTRQNGEPVHPDVMSDRFEALCRRAKVPAIGMHAGLRHLHGSVLLRAGVPLHVVSRRLGHAAEAFTARVYAHVLPGQGAEAAATFAAAIGEPSRERPLPLLEGGTLDA